ncbi:STAS domain-containing protein [Candidatus Uabimicrobium amorphum]|uniref:Anti-sigma factor antagonist n=1 Tax=Uabimicrobium amorphum TaxID=2596890 RepID=A0A5S9F272_UABAM|nr:STAS domain-containing protein [Candidatus Uabimicrobium amorphum]BBM82084.1 anti-sigma factor antagonist [Candidatus Uabimicrobium amorphum]
MTKVLHFKSEKKTLPDNNFIVTCKIIGAIDGRTVYDFEQKIRGFFDQGAKHLVLNFAEVTYINSTGMGLLVKLSDIFQSSDGNIRLVSVPEKVIALFDMLGLLSLFKIYESEQDAIVELTQNILNKNKVQPPKEKEVQIQNTNAHVRRKTPVPPDMPKFKKTPTSLEEQMGAKPLVIDDDSKTAAVQFPYVGDCAVCRRKIEFATPGNYKCNSCSSYISVDINGQQKVHARFNSDVIELTFPCNIYHKNVALFAINGLVQQLGYSTYFWEDIKEVLDSALTIALEKNYLQGKEKLHLLAVADRDEMVIGLKSMNPFLDPNGPKDPRLPAIARKLDKLEVFPLPTRGQLLKMTKRNVSSMQPAM